MDYSQKLALSYYKTIATLNESHNIFLVQHQESHKIFVKKILTVYNIDIYKTLSTNPICGIPQIVDYFESENQLILIENYVSGQSLEEVIRTASLDLHDIIHYALELCTILKKLHEMNPPIVHRDIKPSNIIITEHNHVFLIDYNASKFFSDSSTSDTVLLGTKGYAAPEQYGFGSSSPQTDIYAIGILLKELSSSLPNVSNSLNNVIEKCVKINPSDRYTNVSELENALKSVTGTTSGKIPKFSLGSILLPGYRTRTPWKMLLATPSYLFVLWLSLFLNVENTYGAALWVERIFCLLILLGIIFGTFNYMNIHSLFPLCKSKYFLVRLLGIILLDIMLVATLFILMVIILLAFFS